MTTSTRRRIAVLATALTTAATLAGCAGVADPAGEPSGATTEPTGGVVAGEHNDADTRFAQMMIVHHEGALEMADLMVDRATTPEVRALAERISAAQGPEIELMSGWLTAWGEDAAADVQHGGMDHRGMDMEGMDQDEAMAALEGLTGPELDRRFLELMTAHHRGAVEMATAQLADGSAGGALELAAAVIEDQTAEIAEMEALLRDL